MAGAGYKLFNTGDVLTAAQVNTYLMEQTVMVFADAAARTTALSGVLAEGMISYLKDTNATEVYNGSAWVGITGDGDITGVTAGTGISGGGTTGTVTITNDMATTITAAGDIVVGTGNATYDNLPIGTTGQVLTADTTVSPYKVKWAAAAASGDTFAAGKNKIINGDFTINQRAFTSTTTTAIYTFDRWRTEIGNSGGSSTTISAQTFTPGTAPVAGYEGTNFVRLVTASQTGTNTYGLIEQRLEDARTFANQTITISFWAKAGSGTPKVGISYITNFGSGGSADVQGNISDITLSGGTSWTRYSATFTMPSVSGKTIGAGSYTRISFWASAGTGLSGYTSIGLQNATIDLWGIQMEAGSTATDFQTATGTLAGELAACQRYYYRPSNTSLYNVYGWGGARSTTQADILIPLPVTMRVAPTAVDYSSVQLSIPGVAGYALSALTINTSSNQQVGLLGTSTGLTQYRPYAIENNNSTSGYIGFTAEL